MIVLDLIQAGTFVLVAVTLVVLPGVSSPTLAFGVRVPAQRHSDPRCTLPPGASG